VIQRITGWVPGSVEHSVIRVVEEGIEMEGVVLGGSHEKPFAVRYAVMAYPDGRCRGVTARAIGEPILIELLSDGKGSWRDEDGVLVRGLDGALDADLGITPVTYALTLRRLGLAIGESAELQVAGLDVVGAEIRFDVRRFTRGTEDRCRIDDLETGANTETRFRLPEWTIEVPSRGEDPATCKPACNSDQANGVTGVQN
jgi:hypothetical protein